MMAFVCLFASNIYRETERIPWQMIKKKQKTFLICTQQWKKWKYNREKKTNNTITTTRDNNEQNVKMLSPYVRARSYQQN